ncbi:class I SAM-dependent methyltransferase [bacterium]|nr:class I SAM-dependent methyltransferase [bacterium]
MSDLREYYAQRAAEYDRIYAKPERQEDLRELSRWVAEWVAGRRVLELACGTGWWTRVIAESAASVTATDVNDEVLAIAKARDYAKPVRFRRADAFDPPAAPGEFDAIVAAFWVSHLPLSGLGPFLDSVDDCLEPGGRVVLLDNRYVEGSSTPVARRDADGNTYQIRQLDTGATCEVMKNFFDARGIDLRAAAPRRERDARELPHFWALAYDLLPPERGGTSSGARGNA